MRDGVGVDAEVDAVGAPFVCSPYLVEEGCHLVLLSKRGVGNGESGGR